MKSDAAWPPGPRTPNVAVEGLAQDLIQTRQIVCVKSQRTKKGLERGNHLSRDELDGQKCLPVNEHGGTDE
jgi:hypothetical protein